MLSPTRSFFCLLLGVLFALASAGCSKTPPPQPADTGMAGPGQGGGPGPGRRLAANATAAEVYQQKCQFCHGDKGQGARGGIALTGSAARPEADLEKAITDGRNKMPAFGSQLTPTQIDSLVAHVRKLSPAK